MRRGASESDPQGVQMAAVQAAPRSRLQSTAIISGHLSTAGIKKCPRFERTCGQSDCVAWVQDPILGGFRVRFKRLSRLLCLNPMAELHDL